MRLRFDLKRAAALAIVLGLSLSCANEKRGSASLSTNSAAPLPDLPEPPGVLAELTVASPDGSFRALRELGAPLSSLLPVGYPMLAATLLGLPPLSADSFDPEVPVLGALAKTSHGDPGWVLALHTVSGPELVAKLCTGDHAPFRALAGDPKSLTVLEPSAAAGAPRGQASLGVFDNYLLCASDRELLSAVGPYAARNLPRRARPAAPIALRFSRRALIGELVPALRAAWAGYRTTLVRLDQSERSAHGGRAPDFADPAQVILGVDAGVETVLSLFEGASALELDLAPLPTGLEATLVLAPSEAFQDLVALGAGDAKSLLTLPVETRFALGVLGPPGNAADAAKAAGDDWVRLLGSRLSERDAERLRDALSDWDLGRGVHSTYGYLGGSDPGAFLVADVADAARLERAGHGLLGLLSVPGLRAPVTEFLGQPRLSESVASSAELFPAVQHAKVVFGATTNHSKALLPPLSLAWFVDGKLGFAASGKDADPILKAVVLSARGKQRALAQSPGVAEAVERIGDQAALFAYADARLLGAATDTSAALPLFGSAGKRQGSVFLRIEVSKPVIDFALRSALGH